ncbi:MAG: anti-sigma factor antagonist [Candidatus Omnitrophota bacterium]
MEIKARSKDNYIILDLSGRIDVNSANLVEAVGQCLRDGYNEMLLNFEDVDFIDYMGISAIVLAYKEVVNNNGRIKFTSIPAHLKGMFFVTALDRTIDIYADEDSALNSFKEDRVIENIKKMQLRRRFKRLPIDIKIELRNKTDQGLCAVKVDTLNLSAIGAYIYGPDKFKLGDEVILKFKLPPKQEEMELQAKVVWLSDKQIQPHIHPGIAVEFTHLSGVSQEKLLEFIERNLSFLSTND